MTVLARKLFDTGLFNVLSEAGALGAGWQLFFYTGGTATKITTYNARTAGSANANPVVADINGRFGEIWIDDTQTIKWVLAAASDTDPPTSPKLTRDNVLIEQGATPVDASLVTFLAASAALPVANGGTGAIAAANALANLGALPAAGGTTTGNITRSGKGVVPYFNDAAAVGARIYMQAAGADPTSQPGDWVFEW